MILKFNLTIWLVWNIQALESICLLNLISRLNLNTLLMAKRTVTFRPVRNRWHNLLRFKDFSPSNSDSSTFQVRIDIFNRSCLVSLVKLVPWLIMNSQWRKPPQSPIWFILLNYHMLVSIGRRARSQWWDLWWQSRYLLWCQASLLWNRQGLIYPRPYSLKLHSGLRLGQSLSTRNFAQNLTWNHAWTLRCPKHVDVDRRLRLI